MENLSMRIIFILFAIFCCILSINGSPISEEDQSEGAKSCRALCNYCGCAGFYCGEECICECSKDKDEDMRCISTIQSNCMKMKLPFEVLIQGPSGNQFIRNAFKYDQNHKQWPKEESRNKRSTVVIYKPQSTAGLSDDLQNEQLLLNAENYQDLQFDSRQIVKRQSDDIENVAEEVEEESPAPASKLSSRLSEVAAKAREALEERVARAKEVLSGAVGIPGELPKLRSLISSKLPTRNNP